MFMYVNHPYTLLIQRIEAKGFAIRGRKYGQKPSIDIQNASGDIVTIFNFPSNSSDAANDEGLISVLDVYWFIFPFPY